jgi:hypothetical protein
MEDQFRVQPGLHTSADEKNRWLKIKTALRVRLSL